jgi:hypothetical protein
MARSQGKQVGKAKMTKSGMKRWRYSELNVGKDRWDVALITLNGDGEGE